MAHPTTGAPAPSSAVEPDGPLDLHAVLRRNSACGFDHDLLLRAPNAQSLAAHLRGIRAIVAVLTTESGGDVDLGEWMRSGLVEAIGALASQMDDILYRSNERAQEQQADANERLIAAAPDMHQAASAAEALLTRQKWKPSEHTPEGAVLMSLRAALAKADRRAAA